MVWHVFFCYDFTGENNLDSLYNLGDSTGVPNEKGINIDADTVLEYAISHPK